MCGWGDPPVQQQDGVLAGLPGVGAVQVGTAVVADRLKQTPQHRVILSQLAAVHRPPHHAPVAVGLCGGEMRTGETRQAREVSKGKGNVAIIECLVFAQRRSCDPGSRPQHKLNTLC